MNRRGFLKFLAPAAALIVAPELLIPKRTFFLPPAGGWHDHMTATECIARMAEQVRCWNANPPFILSGVLDKWLSDFNLYGTGILKVEPGRIHHVPLNEVYV